MNANENSEQVTNESEISSIATAETAAVATNKQIRAYNSFCIRVELPIYIKLNSGHLELKSKR